MEELVKAEDSREPDLIGELLADSSPRTKGCLVCNWLSERDDADVWQEAFANPAISGAAILRAMQKRGFNYRKPVHTHRNEKHRV